MAMFLLMPAAEAERLRATTADAPDRLEPRRVAAGIEAGLYALPARVRDDPAFAPHGAAFAGMTEAALDLAVAWPDVALPPI